MRNSLLIFALVILAGLGGWAQSSSPAAPTAKPPVHRSAATAAGSPTAVIETTVGKMTCTLFPDKAPIGVANFIGLATGTRDWTTVKRTTKHGVPLYDNTIFHRVIPDFMIQGGDPAGDGTGDPGYKFKNEVSSDLQFDRPGRLAYANSGPDTNGSQFFITEVATPHLNGGYTIFGQRSHEQPPVPAGEDYPHHDYSRVHCGSQTGDEGQEAGASSGEYIVHAELRS